MSSRSTRPLRVALIGNPASGHLKVFAEYLSSRGHDVSLLWDGSSGGMSLPAVRIEPRRHYRLPLGVLTLLERFRLVSSALHRGRYDVVSAQSVSTHAVMAALCWRGPLVLSFWGSDVHQFARQPRHVRRLLPRVLRRADAIQSMSAHMTEELVALGADPARIAAFTHGIELRRFPLGPVPRSEPVVLSTRALKPLYRIDTLLRAFGILRTSVPAARLRLTSDGPERPRLEALSRELGIAEAVTFLGELPAEGLAAELQLAAVWVSLPPSDGTPLSMLEAMASGAYPVVADFPSLREWLDESRGTLLSEVVPDSIARALEAALVAAAEGGYAVANRRVIEERADRAKNMPHFEELLRQAVDRHGR